jgi:anti-anti-sigma factor
MDEPVVVAPGPAPVRWWALHISGELDLATAPALQARLGRAITHHREAGFVLDLAAVTFVDCAGLRPVLRARNRLGHRLYLRNVPARVLRLLELADVATSLHILPPGRSWPPGARPEQQGIVLEDPFDHRPARPLAVPLGRPTAYTAVAHLAPAP